MFKWLSARQSPDSVSPRFAGPLSVKSNRIVDQTGRPFALRGTSLFWSQWQPQYFNEAAIRWLKKDWGANVVRAPLAVHEDGYLSHPARELEKIEAVLQAAIASDIYVIVDWHSHHPEPAAALEFFSHIAGRYGQYPNVIYELWNEPDGTYRWDADIKPYHEIVARKIRSIDQKNLIVLGTPNWSRDVDVAANDPVMLNNIAYSLHFYAASHGAALRHKAELALKMGAPLLVTEWGTCSADGDGDIAFGEVKQWLHFLKKHEIGYVNWAISSVNETSAALRATASAGGNWLKSDLTPSGYLVRKDLRRMTGL